MRVYLRAEERHRSKQRGRRVVSGLSARVAPGCFPAAAFLWERSRLPVLPAAAFCRRADFLRTAQSGGGGRHIHLDSNLKLTPATRGVSSRQEDEESWGSRAFQTVSSL